MDNPWGELPDASPFVLPGDRDGLRRARDLQLDALPVPYVGSPRQARVYILALNPGWADEAELASADAREQNRLGLTFESTHAFWSLDPRLKGTGGYEWWRPRLRRLADEVGWDAVRERVMCVQWFPYHSRTFSASRVRTASQDFSFELVGRAVAAGRAIVIARGRDLWTRAVPDLATYPSYELRNPRAVFLTPDNMQPGAFDVLVDRLRDRS